MPAIHKLSYHTAIYIVHSHLYQPIFRNTVTEADYRVKVKWYPDNISRRFKWTFKLRSPRIEIDDTDSGEKTKIIVGKTSKNNHAFDKNLTLYGGGEYALIFSPRRNLVQYTFYSILGGVLTYVWLL